MCAFPDFVCLLLAGEIDVIPVIIVVKTKIKTFHNIVSHFHESVVQLQQFENIDMP